MSSAVGGDYGRTSGATSATSAASAVPPEPGQASVGELIGQVTRDLSTLMRQEMELAKAEIRQEVSKAGKGAGMLGGAGLAGYFVLLFLSIAAAWGIGAAIGVGWGALIVAVIWGVIAAVLAVTGRKNLRSVHPKPERTVETAQQIPQALKPSHH